MTEAELRERIQRIVFLDTHTGEDYTGRAASFAILTAFREFLGSAETVERAVRGIRECRIKSLQDTGLYTYPDMGEAALAAILPEPDGEVGR